MKIMGLVFFFEYLLQVLWYLVLPGSNIYFPFHHCSRIILFNWALYCPRNRVYFPMFLEAR